MLSASRNRATHTALLAVVTLVSVLPLRSQAASPPTTFYVEPGSYGTARETDPPAYVRNMAKAGFNTSKDLSWLDAGLEYRVRFESRDDDIRRVPITGLDQPLLLRTRGYLGIKNILDPLRLTMEVTDSRRNHSQFVDDDRDVNEMEVIQAFAEFYLPSILYSDARGNNRPLRLRLGRMAFEVLDRRLLGRNEWRNTTNNFDGARLTLGQDYNDWQLDFMVLKPVLRNLTEPDSPNLDQTFSGLIGHWRSNSPAITLEPHYFRLQQQASATNNFRERDIHAPGLRIYGRAGKDNVFNYDVSAMAQFGDDGAEQQKATALTAEVGYSWQQPAWRPRLSLFYGYASGDRNPFDKTNNRFERFFGFARPWSADDYMIFENIHAPKLKLEFQPILGVRVDAGYNLFWLASSTDRFNNLLAGKSAHRDRSGNSGSYVGQSADIRVRFNLTTQLLANVGYSHFKNGEFTRNRQIAESRFASIDSDFAYIELTFLLPPQ